MDCLVLDFDGVVVDSEPVHLACFQRVLEPLGVRLTRDQYYAMYLGFEDRECLSAILDDNGRPAGEAEIAALLAEKTALMKQALARQARPMPGLLELVGSLADRGVPVAICSSARRDEIELVVRSIGLLERLAAIVAAEDTHKGKPHPMGYRLAIQRLSQITGRPLEPGRCVAVEDSPFGIAAARAAGLKAVGLTGSYAPSELKDADMVVQCLSQLSVQALEGLLQDRLV